jgi:hypothetical protein
MHEGESSCGVTQAVSGKKQKNICRARSSSANSSVSGTGGEKRKEQKGGGGAVAVVCKREAAFGGCRSTYLLGIEVRAVVVEVEVEEHKSGGCW